MKTKILFYFTLLLVINLSAQIATPVTVNSYTNFAYPETEPAYQYGFAPPIYSNLLTTPSGIYVPAHKNQYHMSMFGPRHKHSNDSNIGFFDFHKGTDISPHQTYGTTTFDDESNPPSANCMCDGEVDEIVPAEGLVIIKCDSLFKANSSWGNVYIAYRHLDSIYTNEVQLGDRITKDTEIGLVGKEGGASKVHLHLSVFRKEIFADGTEDKKYLNPMRIFDPTHLTHLVEPLENVEISQLTYDQNSALFRVTIPYNQTNLRRIKLSLPGTSYAVEYDFETIADLTGTDRDNNSIVSGLELFAYPFNRGHGAYEKLWDDYESGEITSIYPASLDAPTNQFFPFLSEGLLETPGYTLDIRATNLPLGYSITDLEIDILDIYGYGVKANGILAPTKKFTLGMILNDAEDATEDDDYSMEISSGDLEFEEDHIIGLQFNNINLPKNVNITKATLQFRANKTQSSPIELKITAENTGNSQPFIDASRNLSDRIDTGVSVTWNTSDEWVEDKMGEFQRVEIKSILNNLVQHGDWSESSPVTLLIRTTNSGEREAEAFDSEDLEKSAYLYVEYEPIPEVVCDTTVYQFENNYLIHYGNRGSSSITKNFTEAVENPTFTISDIDEKKTRFSIFNYIERVKVTYTDSNDIEHVYGEYNGNVQNIAEINIIDTVKSITITLKSISSYRTTRKIMIPRRLSVELSSITSACNVSSSSKIILPEENNVQFYPNPAINFIKIVLDKPYMKTTVIIRNMSGKKLLLKRFSNKENIKLDIRTLPKKSSYILTVRNQNNKPKSFILIVK